MAARKVAFVVRDNLKYRAAAKTAPRLCCWISLTLLGGIKNLADVPPNLAGKTAQVFPA